MIPLGPMRNGDHWCCGHCGEVMVEVVPGQLQCPEGVAELDRAKAALSTWLDRAEANGEEAT